MPSANVPNELATEVLARLTRDPKADAERDMLVLASLDGRSALGGYLDGSTKPQRPDPPTADAVSTPEPLGAYLKAITVEGFRGIGQRQSLELPPGPGLTLVVGRNGSGKSSFAEALELLVTGVSYRWEKRAKVWREGWRNLHHPTAALAAEFHVEGKKGSTRVVSEWASDGDLGDVTRHAQAHGEPRMEVADLGWTVALVTFRPFLSYNELGSLLDEGPSKLFDALSAILGLEELTAAQDVLAEARKARERVLKEATLRRDELLGLLGPLDDDRARTLAAAMGQKDWGLDEVEAVIARGSVGTGAEGDMSLLQQLASLRVGTPDDAAAVVLALREAHQRIQDSAGTLADRSRQLTDILDRTLAFHAAHGDGDCPVCGAKAALDVHWHEHQAREVGILRAAAGEATSAQQAGETARKRALNAPAPTAEVLARAAQVGLDATAAIQALEEWRAGLTPTATLDTLARHVESAAGPLAAALTALRTAAADELKKREDIWKPVAPRVAAWLVDARPARKGGDAVKALKAAEGWLKNTASAIRNERFAPIKHKAQQIWKELRLQSNVSLEDIQLTGSATSRQVELDVTVDGVKAAALGVMSQGEQNALALSLFIPRATLPESPFRFLVIDDPVQSMDPSRIDGLARVLQETAARRQVVVFTHDDRLAEAVRRLAIPAYVIEVARREGSVVELRKSKDPVARYIDDAMAVAQTDGLPSQAARRVVPGLCRLAIEAACTEVVRRRRLGLGESHAAVEDLLTSLTGTTKLVALALFDDKERGGEVFPRLHKERKDFADVFRMVNEGSHVELPGPPVDLVHSARKLAVWLQGLK